MKHKMLKSVAVLGTVGLASLLLVACGSKNNKSASSGDGKNLTVYVEKQLILLLATARTLQPT